MNYILFGVTLLFKINALISLYSLHTLSIQIKRRHEWFDFEFIDHLREHTLYVPLEAVTFRSNKASIMILSRLVF